MFRNNRILLIVIPLVLFMSLWHLETMPPVWWDEGWNLTVARNWVELGHYGRLLNGQPIPAGLHNGFTTVAPVALSFRLLGIGIWQGRLPGVFFMLASLGLMYYLARRLYDRSVAVATLLVLLFLMNSFPLNHHLTVHPAFIGRQVLGENPVLFFLLGGYACFLSAFSRRPFCFLTLASILWGLALITKKQVLPFWIFSLLVPLSLAVWSKHWKNVRLLAIGLFGSLLASQFLTWGINLLLVHQISGRPPLKGLYRVTAFVTEWRQRLYTLLNNMIFAGPTLIGVMHAVIRLTKETRQHGSGRGEEVLRLSLLSLASSWLAWYALLSAGWVRYLYPPIFLGSIFVAAALRDMTQDFNFSSTLSILRQIWKKRALSSQAASKALIVLLIIILVPFTILNNVRYFSYNGTRAALQVVQFLNNQTPSNALIETYDSELFFLLDRRYHYPPDQLSIELVRRDWLGHATPISYDPLAFNPDYLVVGPFSRNWKLYDAVLNEKKFILIQNFEMYSIYRRQP